MSQTAVARVTALGAALLLSLGAAALAAPEAQADTQAVTGTARILGSSGSAPAVGAVVTAHSTSSAATVSAAVDSSGGYSLALDDASTWTLCFTEPASTGADRFLPGQCADTTVDPTLTRTGPAMELEPAGQVNGAVTARVGLDVVTARLVTEANGVWTESSNDPEASVDSDGAFTINDVPTDVDYRLCFDGLDGNAISGPSGCDGADSPEAATPLVVQGGPQSVGTVPLTTVPTPTTVRVTDAAQQPVVGVTVALERQVGSHWEPDYSNTRTAGTSSAGTWTFSAMPGSYRVHVTPDSTTPLVAATLSQGYPVSGSGTVLPTQILPTAGTVNGVLAVPTGESAAGIDVQALAGTTFLASTTSGQDGSYVLTNVPTGAPVQIVAASNDPSTDLRVVSVPNVAVNSSQNLTLTRGATLTGTLLDSDVPNVNATLTAWDPAGMNPTRTALFPNASGAFSIGGLTPGASYDLAIDPNDGRQIRYVRDAAADVGTDPTLIHAFAAGASLGVIDLSGLSGSVPAPSTAAIGGTPAVGATLHVQVDGWSQAAPPEQVLYTWYAGDAAVTDTSSQNTQYLVRPVDIGKLISVEVTGRHSGYRSARTQPSGGTAYTPVQTPTSPTSTTTPVISVTRGPVLSGRPKVGKVLVVSPGVGSPGASAAVQWLRNGAAIPGATRTSYRLGKADKGKRISVRVSYARGGYTPASRTTAATGRVR